MPKPTDSVSRTRIRQALEALALEGDRGSCARGGGIDDALASGRLAVLVVLGFVRSEPDRLMPDDKRFWINERGRVAIRVLREAGY